MKRYSLLIFIVILFFCSCAEGIEVNTSELKEQKERTTIDIQESIKTDTMMYKMIERNGNVYLVNPKNNLVEKVVGVRYNVVATILAFIFILIGIIAVISLI